MKKFLSKILNIAPTEGPHVAICWALGLIGRISLVIGWTLLTVFFVSNYGISALPYLFILHAVGIILGSFIFARLVGRVKHEYLLIAVILISGFLLILGGSLELPPEFFIGFLLLAVSVLHSQFKIVSSLFMEDLFTPTQSSRVFPVIESAQTIGLIIGGLIISIFAPHLPLSKFLYIWMIVFMIGIPAIVYYLNHSIGIPFQELIHYGDSKSEEKSTLKATIDGIKSGFKVGFIRSLVLIVLLQWMFFNILEFQYTKAIEQQVKESHSSFVLHDMNEFGKASVLIAKEASEQQNDEISKVIETPEYYDDFENDFAKDLAMLQILFGAATLVFQLLLASRLLTYLGVVGSMVVYPVVLIVSMASMTINFNFISAIIARFNHEVTHVLHLNAYHSSYYALSHTVRGGVKEFLEGFIRPIGAILGTLLLIILSFIVRADDLTLAINIAAIVILGGMFLVSLKMRNRYDDLPQKDLLESTSLNTLINAINILEQNAAHHDPSFLVKVHKKRSDFTLAVEKKLITAIGNIGTPKQVSYLIDLAENREDILYEVLHAINSIFSRYSDDIKAKPFTWYSLRRLFQDLLTEKSNSEIRAEVISFIILSNYHKGLVDEIIILIDNDLDERTITVCADTLRKINDQHVVSFLKHLLKSSSPRIRSAVLYVMSEYEIDYSEIYEHITAMLASKDEVEITEALILVHRLNAFDYFEPCLIDIAINHTSNIEILFLVKACYHYLGYSFEFTEFLYTELLYHDLFKVVDLIEKLNDPIITKSFRRRVYSEIHRLYIEYSQFESLDSNALNSKQLRLLKELQGLFELVNAEKEFYLVEEILR